MGKFSLEWHRNCLKNMEAHLAREEQVLIRANAAIVRTRERVDFTRNQIAEAERRGLDGFDADRLLIKGKP